MSSFPHKNLYLASSTGALRSGWEASSAILMFLRVSVTCSGWTRFTPHAVSLGRTTRSSPSSAVTPYPLGISLGAATPATINYAYLTWLGPLTLTVLVHNLSILVKIIGDWYMMALEDAYCNWVFASMLLVALKKNRCFTWCAGSTPMVWIRRLFHTTPLDAAVHTAVKSHCL